VPALIAYERTHAVELVLQPWYFPTVPSTRHLTLAVFDLDSTLIDQEIIDELARSTGMLPAVAAITERTMRGELDFTESLKSRVALLKGTPTDVWEAVRERMTLAEGSRELCRGLGKLGTKMAVLSGGFVQIAEWVKGELGLHVAEANHVCCRFCFVVSNHIYLIPKSHAPVSYSKLILRPCFPNTGHIKDEIALYFCSKVKLTYIS
jgi:HAD superfamily phosphoserine phosphatase-like hydrolase